MGIGMTELLVILGLALLFFGGKKLPELARGLGRGVREFKQALGGIEDLEDEINKPLPKDKKLKDSREETEAKKTEE
jgi:sec-independent protein translocase protein TatA